MPGHRRGRSLSEGLTLEEAEDGGLVISSINDDSSANQGLREGDEVVGAAINFDELSKEEVLKVLKLMEPFDDKMKVLTKSNLSKSLGTISIKSPAEMLKDSYTRLYNNKIKKYMKGDLPGSPAGGAMGGSLTGGGTRPRPSTARLKHDAGMPRLGVDFAVPRTKTPSIDVPTGFQSGDVTFSAPVSGDDNMPNASISTPNLSLPKGLDGALEGDFSADLSGSKLDLPLPRLGLKATADDGAIQGPRLNIDAGNSEVDAALPKGDLEFPSVDVKGSDVDIPDVSVDPPEGNISGPTFDINAPKLDIEDTKKFKMPKFKMPHLGLSEPIVSGPEYQAPDISSPGVALKGSELDLKIPSGKIRVRSSRKLKNPDLNVDDPTGYVKVPQLKLLGLDGDTDMGGKTPNVDLQTPSINAPSLPEVELPSVKGLKSDLDMPDADIGGPSGTLKMPSLSGPDLSIDAGVKIPNLNLKIPKMKGGVDVDAPRVNLPEVNLKAPQLEVDTPDLNIKAPSGKYKAPKFKMPAFGFSGPHGPELGIRGNLEGPDYELKTPDLDLSAPNIKGGISPPDLKSPKLDLNAPDINLDMPSGKLDLDADTPSGKLKMPKFKLFGTLPKKKDLDINAGLNSPNLSLSRPKMKGIDAPDVNLPSVDLKAPKLDVKSPNVNIGSPKGKFKMPKLKMPNFDIPKGPDFDIDGDLDGPDLRLPSGHLNADLAKPELDINAPSLNLKGPKTELDMPDIGHFKMPDFGLSGPNIKGPNVDLKIPAPDFSLKAPRIKGGIDAPDWDLPNMDFKAPKLDLNTPDVNIGSPKGKFKMPKLKMPKFSLPGLKGPDVDIDGDIDVPDIDINAPNVNLKGPKAGLEMPDPNLGSLSGKFKKPNLKMPDFGFSGPKLEGPNFDLKSPDLDLALPKGPDLDINTNLKTPDLSLKAPRIKGGIDAPHLDLPNLDFKAPKLDLNTPDVNMGSPKGKFKMPKLKMPKFSLPGLKGPDVDIDGDIEVPDIDINAPNVNLKGPKAGLEMPDVNLGSLSGKFKKPNLKMPDFGFSGPKLEGPNFDLKSPDLDLSGPELSGGIGPLGLNMPKVDHKTPKLNLNAPDWDLPNLDFKAPKLDLNTPDVNIGSPKGKFKMPKLKMPKFSLSGLKGPDVDIDGDIGGAEIDINAPDVNLKGPKAGLGMPEANFGSPSAKFKKPHLKMPDVMLDFGLSGTKLEEPNFDLNSKGPELDINTHLKTPDLRLKAPRIKGGIDAPDLDLPNMDFKPPKLHINTPGINLPNVDLPKASLKGPKLDLGAPKYDIDTPGIDIGSPSGKLNMPKMPKLGLSGLKGPDLRMDGDVEGPGVNFRPPKAAVVCGPNVDLSIPKAGAPDLDVDAPSVKLRGPSYKNRRSEGKMPVLDVDADVKLPQTNRRPRNPKLRSSYPLVDSDIANAYLRGTGPDLRRPDLNIDDFTGSEHVLRARGSNMDLSMPTVSHPDIRTEAGTHRPQVPAGDFDIQTGRSRPRLNATLPNMSRDAQRTESADADGYYVTVFPDQVKNGKTENGKSNTLGRLDVFSPSNVDLDVPDGNDLKGSTFWFSKLI